ncbi:Predicted membrane protein [Bordetella trematum]|uniref:hypothetical protein n=1 Tax=Bordetella trematum TaxID=123899 RepID=UPI00079A7BBC|nr:Predicted membrane protein [Bordetella trematum]
MMSTSAPDRLTHLDALRGFALMGIALVNYQVFASAYYGSGFPQPGFDTVWDRATLLALAVFFEAKFYLLFSFLFGYSFYLQMQAAERAGAAFGARMGRRLAGLAALGLAHGLLFSRAISCWPTPCSAWCCWHAGTGRRVVRCG